MLRTGSINSVRVKAQVAHKALDRASKASDLADLVSDARNATTWTGKAAVAARGYATGFVCGTVLYGTYEDAQRRSGSHVAGGALGGVAHGALAHLLSAESLPKSGLQLQSLLRGVPAAASRDGVSHAVLFGTYSALKRKLTGSEERPIEAEASDTGLVFNARNVAAILGAGSVAGAGQSMTQSALSRAPVEWRPLLRSSGASGIGFAAFELGVALARRQGEGS